MFNTKKLQKATLAGLLAITLAIPAHSGMQLKASYYASHYADALEITDAGSLVDFINQINSGSSFKDKTVILTQDIQLFGYNWKSCTGEFSGTFDGQGYTISGMTITDTNSPAMTGLFGKVTGTVKNLKIANAKITIGGNTNAEQNSFGIYNAGVICAKNTGTIINCSVDADLAVDTYYNSQVTDNVCQYAVQAGGLCGENAGTIQNCSSNSKITYQFSYANGYQTMDNNTLSIGGIAGSTLNAIKNCYYTGQISYIGTGNDNGKNIAIGGISGKLEKEKGTSRINNCYSSGGIETNVEVKSEGSIAGYSEKNTKVEYCYGVDKGNLELLGETSNGTKSYSSKITQEELQSQSFLDQLNKRWSSNKDFSKWTLGNHNYPEFIERYRVIVKPLENGKLKIDVENDGNTDDGYIQENSKVKMYPQSASSKNGYMLKSITVKTVSGRELPCPKEGSSYYAFYMPNEDVEVEVIFVQKGTAVDNTTAPQTTVTPQRTITPQTTVTPQRTITPQTTVTPQRTITPQTTVIPQRTITPQTTVTPQRTITPQTTVTPQTTIAPVPTDKPIKEERKSVKPGKTKLKKAVNKKGKKINVIWSKTSNAEGYEVCYATNKRFSKCGEERTTGLSKTVSGFIKGKTYYIRVRAYRYDNNGKMVYGKYSAVKKVKVKK